MADAPARCRAVTDASRCLRGSGMDDPPGRKRGMTTGRSRGDGATVERIPAR